ncbi:hypothetical protein CQW23_29659 [Capsicum baccatum]|uniref:Fringe-related protein n=1 Tax=Capsicum baccatum TaxID=33114 RepID=A0A2G2VCS8_CAPBA|nr:hypothetical protein CQW23_29659 [Capsicum baccatum]
MVFRPSLLYRAGFWQVKKSHIQKIKEVEMRMLRLMCGCTRKDRIRNGVIRDKVGVALVEAKMREARISSDNSRYAPYNKHRMPFAIRMVRVIEETFMLHHGPGVRWYVMADDDTVLMIDNLVNVLTKYDHTKYYYVGMNSECIVSNFGNSFQMAFGGAGYALSYPLAQAVAKNMDTCIKRYPYLYGSDHILQACIADLGVTITLEKGFHQIDLRRDISGFLSAHPQSPFLSLHHLDLVAPIFPSMNRFEALNHLMKAASVDQSRLLQQSTCYNKLHNWTFSVSWGYSVQIYDKIQSQSYLATPIETFGEWRKGAWPPYMFNVRGLKSNNGNSCGEVPNVLFFDSWEGTRMNHIVTTYVKKTPRSCGNDDHPIDGILKIRVFSPMHKLHVGANTKGSRLGHPKSTRILSPAAAASVDEDTAPAFVVALADDVAPKKLTPIPTPTSTPTPTAENYDFHGQMVPFDDFGILRVKNREFVAGRGGEDEE